MEEGRNFLNGERIDVVVHHSPCDDGHAAAALFYYNDKTVLLHGLHPKAELLTPAFCKLIIDKNVVFVDIAFSAEVMTKAAALARKIIVLDHHVTNRTILENLSLPNLRSVFLMDIAGVRLAWRFINGICDDSNMPKSLYYIALKDVWQHESNIDALHFTTAFSRPKTWDDWIPFIEGEIETRRIVEQGRVIYDYQRSVLNTMMEKVEHLTWRGYRIAIVNVPFPWISDIGAMMCQTESERTIAVIWNKPAKGPYSVSLRSHNPDGPNIEQIALEFNGGGHVHGAGLRTERPPYEIFNDEQLLE
jgi:nanoRNase/pAp phosphatase (c-di-AMP/oligoRNAs hydrolase)